MKPSRRFILKDLANARQILSEWQAMKDNRIPREWRTDADLDALIVATERRIAAMQEMLASETDTANGKE